MSKTIQRGRGWRLERPFPQWSSGQIEFGRTVKSEEGCFVKSDRTWLLKRDVDMSAGFEIYRHHAHPLLPAGAIGTSLL
ncbi:MAG: hypothetical protein LBR08_00635 [Bacteroidales bacterium]|nr:hypothetical protein [Bacteroidales bacterium]